MSTEKNIRIRQRIDSSANWNSKNGTLLQDEIGIDSTNRVIKYGNWDGQKWNNCTTLYNPGDEYVTWEYDGTGRNNGLNPISAALASDIGLNQNILAFMKPTYITIETSVDGGETWTEVEVSDNSKQQLVTSAPQNNNINFYVGNFQTVGNKYAEGTPRATTNDMLRITIDALGAGIYASTCKYVFNVTNIIDSMKYWVKMEGMYYNTEDWYTIIDKQKIVGWSGLNTINKHVIFGGSQSYSNTKVRFIFGRDTNQDDISTNYAYNGAMALNQILVYGMNKWNTKNPFATQRGHLYTYDLSKNAEFPANVTATKFIGTATAAEKLTYWGYRTSETAVEGNYIKIGEFVGPGAQFGYYNGLLTISTAYSGITCNTATYSISLYSNTSNKIVTSNILIGQTSGRYYSDQRLKYYFDEETQTISLWYRVENQYQKIYTTLSNVSSNRFTAKASINCLDTKPDGLIDANYYMPIPAKGSQTPVEDGSAAANGSSESYARADHVHPKFIDATRGTGTKSINFNDTNNIVSGSYSIATGQNNEVSGHDSAAIGKNNKAYGNCSVAIGEGTGAYGANTFTVGKYSSANGDFSLVGGEDCSADGSHSLVFGKENYIENDSAIALGEGLQTSADNQTVIGKYNVPQEDSIFEIGCGADDDNRQNAFRVSNDATYIQNDLITDKIHSYGNLETTAAEISLAGMEKITLTAPEIHLNTTNNDSVYLGDNNQKIATVDQIQTFGYDNDKFDITSDTVESFNNAENGILKKWFYHNGKRYSVGLNGVYLTLIITDCNKPAEFQQSNENYSATFDTNFSITGTYFTYSTGFYQDKFYIISTSERSYITLTTFSNFNNQEDFVNSQETLTFNITNDTVFFASNSIQNIMYLPSINKVAWQRQNNYAYIFDWGNADTSTWTQLTSCNSFQILCQDSIIKCQSSNYLYFYSTIDGSLIAHLNNVVNFQNCDYNSNLLCYTDAVGTYVNGKGQFPSMPLLQLINKNGLIGVIMNSPQIDWYDFNTYNIYHILLNKVFTDYIIENNTLYLLTDNYKDIFKISLKQ